MNNSIVIQLSILAA